MSTPRAQSWPLPPRERILEEFQVPFPRSKKGAFYKAVMGMRIKGIDTPRYRCMHPECREMWLTPTAVAVHSGREHPTETTARNQRARERAREQRGAIKALGQEAPTTPEVALVPATTAEPAVHRPHKRDRKPPEETIDQSVLFDLAAPAMVQQGKSLFDLLLERAQVARQEQREAEERAQLAERQARQALQVLRHLADIVNGAVEHIDSEVNANGAST